MAVPEKFDNKPVIVQGTCSFDSKEGIMYITDDAYKQKIYRNSVKIKFSTKNTKDYSHFDGKVVYVKGKYIANKNKSLKNDFAGIIRDSEISVLKK